MALAGDKDDGDEGGGDPLGACAARVAQKNRLAPGKDRHYSVKLVFAAPKLSQLEATVGSALETPAGLEERIKASTRAARDCLPLKGQEGPLPRLLSWHTQAGKKEVTLGWLADPKLAAKDAEKPVA